jgi:hypothetical protein
LVRPKHPSPAITDDLDCAGSGDKYVFTIDSDVGQKLCPVSTDGGVHSSPTPVAGALFVGSADECGDALTETR